MVNGKPRHETISYKLADGKTVPVEVSPAVARFLVQEEKRERTRRRDDRRFLDKDGYVEGETELLLHDLGESVVEKVERKQRNTIINKAVNALPPRMRGYIHAYYFKGYTMQEIADMEHIDKTMVHRVVKKARANLRNMLTQNGNFQDFYTVDGE